MTPSLPRASEKAIHAIELPWPSKLLHPNARPHWAVKARAARAARLGAAWAATAAKVGRIDAERLSVTLAFTPPDARHRDTDGMLSAMKSALDGIADVVGVDDSKWSISMRREQPRKPGSVRVEIEVVG